MEGEGKRRRTTSLVVDHGDSAHAEASAVPHYTGHAYQSDPDLHTLAEAAAGESLMVVGETMDARACERGSGTTSSQVRAPAG